MLVENMYRSIAPLSQEAFAKIGLRGAPAEDVRYDFYRSDGFLTDGMLEAFRSRCREYGLIPLLGYGRSSKRAAAISRATSRRPPGATRPRWSGWVKAPSGRSTAAAC